MSSFSLELYSLCLHQTRLGLTEISQLTKIQRAEVRLLEKDLPKSEALEAEKAVSSSTTCWRIKSMDIYGLNCCVKVCM